MRCVIQRSLNASVKVNGETRAAIGRGLLIYLAVLETDTGETVRKVAGKIVRLRIFDDENGKMNDSLVQRGYATLLVPQFTLYAELKKGNRPFYGTVASPSHATRIFDCMARELSAHGESQTGVFGANMKIESANDGPVTLILDSDEI